MKKTIAVIYPVPKKLVGRLFDGKINVFVKCLGHHSTRLMPENKVIFYASRDERKLIGEGTIDKLEFLSPEEVLERYEKTLFLSKSEFITYVRNRQRVLTFKLKNLKRYAQPIASTIPITMTGKYLTAYEYSSLFK